jgi:murein DD-endopeptidase MepM/ murein hydrolase activator NlpD
MIRVVPSRSRWKPRATVLIVLVLLAGAVIAYLSWRQSVPGAQATLEPVPAFIGRATPLTLVVEAHRGGVEAAEVRVVQGSTSAVAFKQAPAGGARHESPVTVEGAALGLKEGAATLEVWARDDFWRPLGRRDEPVLSIPVTVDLTAPAVEVLSATQYVHQGGGGLVAFRARGAQAGEVRAGSLAYPSVPVGDDGARIALIALPWDHAVGASLTVTAWDQAGNTTTRSVPAQVRPRKFRHDTVTVTDALLEAKVPELLPHRPPDQSLLDSFLVINRDLRRQAEDEKRGIARTTRGRALWQGPFVQPRNTKVFSNFAETRRYIYRDADVDTQVHLGYDLASVKQSPVPAANRGVVVFAGPLTIYGNTVILDHGLGLQTLYGHQSRIEVKVGDQVEKGQTLGHTGTTGLAVGDHLHFEVLIHGVAVSPIEWWDAKWIRDHIDKPLQEAGLPLIGAE